MVNLFPIQFLALLAYMTLRVGVGLILMHLGLTHIRNRTELAPRFSFPWFPYGKAVVWYLGVVEIIISTMFILGFLTQLAAILAALLALKFILMHTRFKGPMIPGRLFYVLLFFVSCSLFITGAGAFAFDLPI